MRTLFIFITFLGLFHYTFAQNYYVASMRGEVYYQNKLLKKKDKVAPQGNIRFKSADGQVRLSGPGGLYTLSAQMGRPAGNEFLLTLSRELFPSVRPISTVSPTFTVKMPYENIAYQWWFNGGDYTLLDPSTLPIRPQVAQKGQTIAWLHETSQGLAYRKASIQKDSLLVLRASDFNLGVPIVRTLVVRVSNQALLDSILKHQTNLKDVIALPAFNQESTSNQILDELGACRFVKRKDFLKELRFHIKKSGAQSQYQFLEMLGYQDYIRENYGRVYHLNEIMAQDLKLPEGAILKLDFSKK